MAEVRTYFYDQNAALQLEEERLYDPALIKEQRRREKERREIEARRAKALYHRQNRFYTVMLTVGVALFALFFVGLVNMQNAITTSLNHISSLETEISDLKADNSATENRINASANLQGIRWVAIANLGMVYANNDQIVYYDMDNTDSMNQYKNIP